MAVSFRGVARRYRNAPSGFLAGASFGRGWLRSGVESLARHQCSFGKSECIFGWTAAFEQTWSHIVIRIKLNPNAGIPAAAIATCMTTWANGIRNVWSNRWGVGHSGEMDCPLTFEAQWVTGNEHHDVEVRAGSGRANMGTFFVQSGGNVAAHEFGHMFGLVDEYADSLCPGRSPVGTGTVMDNNSNHVPARFMTRFADNIGSSVVAI